MMTTPRRIAGLGWRRQTPDHRDAFYRYSPQAATAALPSSVDLRHSGFNFPVYDQGQIGSCTGNATAALIEFVRKKEGLADADRVPSRLMLYYGARFLEGNVSADAGAEVRDALKAAAQWGTCFEDGPDGWPYDVTKFADKPPDNCYQAATKDRALKYSAINQSLNDMKACLAEGFPFVFGFTVFSELDGPEVQSTGRLPIPGASSSAVGGHCVMAVGYDDANGDGVFLIRNSWGDAWAPRFRGCFMMPYAYITNPDLSSDFWTIRLVG